MALQQSCTSLSEAGAYARPHTVAMRLRRLSVVPLRAARRRCPVTEGRAFTGRSPEAPDDCRAGRPFVSARCTSTSTLAPAVPPIAVGPKRGLSEGAPSPRLSSFSPRACPARTPARSLPACGMNVTLLPAVLRDGIHVSISPSPTGIKTAPRPKGRNPCGRAEPGALSLSTFGIHGHRPST